MTVTLPLTINSKIRQRNLIKLPEAFLMINGLGKKDEVKVTIGQNFSCVIITPIDAKVSERMQERIKILATDPLDSTR